MSGRLISADYFQNYIKGPVSEEYKLSFNENSLSLMRETGKFCGRVVSCLASVPIPLVSAINTAYSVVMAAIEPPVLFLYSAVQFYRAGSGVLSSTHSGVESAEKHFRTQVENILDNGRYTVYASALCVARLAYAPVFEVVNVAGSAVFCASYLLKNTIAALDSRFGSARPAFSR